MSEMSIEDGKEELESKEMSFFSSETPPSGLCAVCGKTSAVYCPRCRLIGYCSHDHRLSHWEAHDKECVVVHPVKVKRVNKRRALVVRNHFKSGAMIFLDTPIIRGPDDNLLSPETLRYYSLTNSKEKSSCVTCCSLVSEGRTCPKCEWPVCSEKCSQDPVHSHMECVVFQGKTEADFNLVKPSRFILILRCLLTRDTDPKTWNKILSLDTNPLSKQVERLLDAGNPILDRHLKKLHTEEKEVLNDVMRHLRQFQLQKRFSRNLVSRIMQLLNWNALPMEMETNKESMLLYPRATIAQHSCSPNAIWFLKSTHQLFCHARMDISVDKPIFISRINDDYLFKCTLMRRQQLANLNIHCICERCASPSELGSHFSTMKCINFEFFDSVKGCKVGNLEAMDPCNQDAPWKCQSCQCIRSSQLIHNYVTRVQLELDEAKQWANTLRDKECDFANENSFVDILGLQKLISALNCNEGITVHKNHSLIFQAKFFIIENLSNGMADVFGLNISLTKKIMEMLVDAARLVERLCDDCLTILELVLPGLSLRHGEIIYHKQFSLGILLPAEFRQLKESLTNGGSLIDFQKRFEEAKIMREKTRFMLSFYKEFPKVSKMLEFMMLDEIMYSTLQKHIDQYAPETCLQANEKPSPPTLSGCGWNSGIYSSFDALFEPMAPVHN